MTWGRLVFQIAGKSHRWFQYLRMSGKGLQLKTTTPLVFFLWLGKSLKNLYIIVLLISYRNVDFFPEFLYGFRSFSSISDLLTVVSGRIGRAFNRSKAVALDISKVFDWVWHVGLCQKPKSYGIFGQIFNVFSSFLIKRRLRVIQDENYSQEYPLNAEVPQCSIVGPALLLLYINDLFDDVICNITIYADDATL